MRQPTRIAVIGRQRAVVALIEELEINAVGDHSTVGWIASDGCVAEFPSPQALGGVGELAAIVREHRIDLLLLGSEVPRLAVFDELVSAREPSSVRVCDLTAFYEDLFGHIPVSEINSTWFQYIMHPRFRATTSATKRGFDLIVATLLGIAVLPLLAIAAVLIKLSDGAPVLYRQQRIGEQGHPFWMYKLRTMRPCPEDHAQVWCAVGDPRVTRAGRLLRSLHIDELPQLYNVLRGDMSMVGPRPEQPDISARLEAQLPFYSRRQLIRPGLTGWAQVRCGYAGSERGSAWKLSHDLYYLKHQTLAYDISILMRTLAILAPRRRPGPLRDAPFVTRSMENAGQEVVPESLAL
jgi:exopolysaccharide biosynthesis polyprenyl glycosylphosphotransferase